MFTVLLKLTGSILCEVFGVRSSVAESRITEFRERCVLYVIRDFIVASLVLENYCCFVACRVVGNNASWSE